MHNLARTDPEVAEAIRNETRRQGSQLELIASENFVSEAVLEALGTVLTNKYAEGYPGKRYYGGCEFVDVAETLAIQRAKQLFSADHANVQPHSGAQANMSVYMTVCQPGDTILGMNLSHGGHLTHGHPLNFSGRYFKVVAYGVRKEDERIDYEAMAALAREHRPRILVVGASAYPRTIDFVAVRKAADECGAVVMADMAHIAGLVAAGLHPSPVPHAEFVTTTTHKTLRGPRGGMILCQEKWAKETDKLLFPGVQGGPLMHIIAAKAVCFGEALGDGFRDYAQRVVANARTLATTLRERGIGLVSGGTDNHLLLLDLRQGTAGGGAGLTGKEAEEALHRVGITVNKNAVPGDPQKPWVTSGVRIGTPALTTRGMGEAEMRRIGERIAGVLERPADAAFAREASREVRELADAFPLFTWQPGPRPEVRAG